jgi:hypothetical protein
MSDNVYNPGQSQISGDSLADFLRSPITGNICEVPGISPKQAKILALGGDSSDRITNTFQLIGKFLLLKTLDENTGLPITSQEHCNAFWQYLKYKGITSHRTGIVQAVAEKMNISIPGIYDASEFE